MSGVFRLKRIVAIFAAAALIASCSFVVSFADSGCPKGGEHDYTVTIVKRATENSNGVRKYVCSKCGKTYTEAIPATGHRWSKWITDKKATCTRSGHAYRKCIKHREFTHYQYKKVAALGHDYQVKVIEPTSSSMGMKIYTCVRCGESYSVPYSGTTGQNATANNVTKTEKSNVSKLTKNKSKSAEPAGVTGTSKNTVVPFGTADAAILGANGIALFWFVILLLPLVRVMFWVAKKRREAEDEQ